MNAPVNTVEVNIKNITGAALDWAVGCLFLPHGCIVEGGVVYIASEAGNRKEHWHPTDNGTQGIQIIDTIDGFQSKIWLESKPDTKCEAHIHNYEGNWIQFGPTFLVAAMRCYLATGGQDNIQVPAELVQTDAAAAEPEKSNPCTIRDFIGGALPALPFFLTKTKLGKGMLVMLGIFLWFLAGNGVVYLTPVAEYKSVIPLIAAEPSAPVLGFFVLGLVGIFYIFIAAVLVAIAGSTIAGLSYLLWKSLSPRTSLAAFAAKACEYGKGRHHG